MDDLEEPRYVWTRIGEVSNLNAFETFELVNVQGFNSASALLAVSKEQENAITAKVIANRDTQAPTVQMPYSAKIAQINPTLYEVDIDEDIKTPVVISFAKPFSANWRFSASNEKPLLINGYINGWYVIELKAGKYYIFHRPQNLYVLGLWVSGITWIGIITYLLISANVVTKSEPISKSQG